MKIIDRNFLKTDTPTCHASTMAFYRDNLAQAWFGGSREGQPDSSIYISYKGQIKVLKPDFLPTFNGMRLPLWNPVLFPIQERLYLFWKAGIFCDRWQTFITDISGIETAEPNTMLHATLPAGLNGPVKTKPIVMDNMIYCGSSVETICAWASYIETYRYKNGLFSFVDRSKPLTIPTLSRSKGLIQPAIWEQDRKLHCFMRSSTGAGCIYYSKQSNGKWIIPKPTAIENPNASVDVVYTEDRLFLVCNPSAVSRFPLKLLELNPETFDIKDEMIVQDMDDNKTYYSPEFSYPYLIEHCGNLHLTYTYARTKIEHCVISI